MKFQQVPCIVRLRHFAIEHLKMRISLTSWARKSCKRFIISPFIRPKIPKLGESLPGHKRNSLISFSNHSSHGITAWEMSKKQVPKFLCNLTWFWIPTKLILAQSSLTHWSERSQQWRTAHQWENRNQSVDPASNLQETFWIQSFPKTNNAWTWTKPHRLIDFENYMTIWCDSSACVSLLEAHIRSILRSSFESPCRTQNSTWPFAAYKHSANIHQNHAIQRTQSTNECI